ncbi:MAG: YceI family protein [Caulobacterales bacterium]|nr:YceI family protein [Caulobacterales bacterium]
MIRPALAAALGLALIAAPAFAQPPAGGAPPAPQVPAVISKDSTKAPTGTYKLDERHAAVVARIGHGGGFSYSVFRFDKVSGTLNWDGADVTKSKVNITVDPASITSNVAGFADELKGDRFLNTPKLPTATFVSTKVEKTGATTGKITGDLTFMGVTKPIVVDAELIGAGNNARNVKIVGFHGKSTFTRADWGFTAAAGAIGPTVELTIDLEFNMQ